MKSQSAVISTILLSGVILSIVTATYIWGRPLVQKTTDKIKVDSLIDNLKIIMDKVEHTQQTGSPSEVVLNIKNANYRISESDNAIIIETNTLIPVIASYTYTPISYTELAYETQLIDVNTSRTITGVSTPTGYDGGAIHYGNKTINGVGYNLTVYNTSNTVYDHVCIYQGTDISDLNAECAEELENINKAGIDYIIAWVSNDGGEVIISGGEEENIGVLGSDPSGVISGKSQPISSEQKVTLKLNYRGLRDANGREYKTFIECDSGCRASSGIINLKIERDRVQRTSNQTNYYLKVYFD